MSDLISREALCEYALNQKDKSITPNDIMRFPSAQPDSKETSYTHKALDTISRQAAIGAIVAQTIGYTADEIKAECEENIFKENGYLGGLKDAIEAIEDMPSAQPEREKGHWIDKTDPDWDGEWDDWQCSCCGSLITSMARNLNGLYLYCPKCGARMEETNEDD